MKSKVTGIPSLIDGLDKMTSGFQNSEMIFIGAPSSVGKTAFALNLACKTAIHQHISCGFFTLKMSAESLVRQILSLETEIESQKLTEGLLTSSDFRSLGKSGSHIYESPLCIDDTPNIKLLELLSSAHLMKTEHDIRILIVDNIDLISTENQRISRHEHMAEVSRSLKSLAEELDIPVIVLSQVHPSLEDKAPGLADLRESGTIEQDADIIMFLHEHREISEPAPHSSDSIDTELIVAKNRNGSVGTLRMDFVPRFMRFETDAY